MISAELDGPLEGYHDAQVMVIGSRHPSGIKTGNNTVQRNYE